jgi:hypothetical protein
MTPRAVTPRAVTPRAVTPRAICGARRRELRGGGLRGVLLQRAAAFVANHPKRPFARKIDANWNPVRSVAPNRALRRTLDRAARKGTQETCWACDMSLQAWGPIFTSNNLAHHFLLFLCCSCRR